MNPLGRTIHINVIPDQSKNINSNIAFMKATFTVTTAEKIAWGEVIFNALTSSPILR